MTRIPAANKMRSESRRKGQVYDGLGLHLYHTCKLATVSNSDLIIQTAPYLKTSCNFIRTLQA